MDQTGLLPTAVPSLASYLETRRPAMWRSAVAPAHHPRATATVVHTAAAAHTTALAMRAVARIIGAAAVPQPSLLAWRIAVMEAAMQVLPLPIGGLQFMLAKAGLLASMTLADHEALYLAMLREGPLRRSAKTLVGRSGRFRAGRMNKGSCLVRHVGDGLVTLICDSSLMSAAVRSDFIVPKSDSADFIPQRLTQPYGYTDQEDGSRVISSRDGLLLWHVFASGAVRQMNPWKAMPPRPPGRWVDVEEATGREWSSDVGQRWARDLLAQHGIQELPLLVGVLPYLMGNELELEEAVKVMQADRTGCSL